MNRKGTFLYQFGKSFAVPIFRILFPSWENNPERVPENGPLIICCNHVCNEISDLSDLFPKAANLLYGKKRIV